MTKPIAFLRTSFSLRLVLALMLVQMVGAVIGLTHVPHGPSFTPGNLSDKLMAWDAAYYFGIAQGGYQWNPALAARHFYNVAFFPLWALVDWICILIFGSFCKFAIVLVSWACGLASIFCFEKLARKTLGESAETATALYAFWPASSFYLMGYPTGIINICAIIALYAYFSGRVWWAAAAIGLGSCAAPTIIFVGAPIGIDYLIRQLRSNPIFIAIRNAWGWALLSLSGMLLFLLYQKIVLGGPMAFIKVQAAWGYSPPPLEKLTRLASLGWDTAKWTGGLQNLAIGRQEVASGRLVEGSQMIQGSIQVLVNFISCVLCLAGLVACLIMVSRNRIVLAASGFAVLFGYLWFIMLTNANMLSTPRLLFPAIAMFLGLGASIGKLPAFLRWPTISIFALASLMEVIFVVAGYWVV